MQDIYLFDVAVVHVFNNRIRKSISLDWCLYLCCNLKRYLKCVSFTYQQPPSLGSSVLLLRELLWRSKFSYKAQWLRHLTARIQLLERIKLCSIFAELIVISLCNIHSSDTAQTSRFFYGRLLGNKKKNKKWNLIVSLFQIRQSGKPSEMYLK